MWLCLLRSIQLSDYRGRIPRYRLDDEIYPFATDRSYSLFKVIIHITNPVADFQYHALILCTDYQSNWDVTIRRLNYTPHVAATLKQIKELYMVAGSSEKILDDQKLVAGHGDHMSSPPGKEPGTTSGNDDYGSTEREPDDGHDRVDEPKPHL
jgi:hypothetical protein